jgi:nucleoid-associated protein YgaU
MNRYKNTKIRRDIANGKLTSQYYSQSIPASYPRDSRDTYFYSREGDRLDSLANEFYKDVTLWPVIASANNLGKGTLAIPAGKLIRIPYNREFTYNGR